MTQEEALDILKMGHCVFLTGEAGTGKTHVLTEYIRWLHKHEINHAVTASTGIAATHLQGTTIHSWSGIGIKEGISEYDLERMEQKRPLWTRLTDARVLIIEEISMLSDEFFAMTDRVLRHMKRTNAPFGGIQVVCSGDFFQLPPVTKGNGEYRYAFESEAWNAMNPVVCYLTQQYRHTGNEFLSMLSAIRNRAVTKEIRTLLAARHTPNQQTTKDITRLFTHNKDVDALNATYLKALKGKEKTFTMQRAGRAQYVDSLIRGCLAPETLVLKEGAKVMFVKNDHNNHYVNGTQGVIVKLQDRGPLVKTKEGNIVHAEPASWKREEDDKVLAEITQVPLRLAWAITVHKSQGMTLDEAEIDLSECFVPGQGYVALSRVRKLEGLYLMGLNDMALTIEERVATADVVFQKRSALAAQRLAGLLQQDIQGKHDAFIQAAGGTIEIHTTTRKKAQKKTTLQKTQELLDAGMKLEHIAKKRGLTMSTIVSHAEQLLQQGMRFDFSYATPNKKLLPVLQEAIRKHGFEKLAPIKYFLEQKGHRVSYDQLRLMRLSLWPQTRYNTIQQRRAI